MAQIMKSLIFLAFTVPLASPVTHSMQYFYTAVTQGISFPQYTAVGLVDGEQFVYYDSNIRKIIPKTEWIKKNEGEDYWTRETQKQLGTEETFKVNVQTLMDRFNQTNGVHTVQQMYGCELHDDGTKRGYVQFGYDGEDFISLDLNTGTWTAAKPQAVITKQKLDPDVANTNYWKNTYLMNVCIEWLQKYVGYGKDTLERKVRPEADLFQKDSSVVCHATGFFPKAVMISWRKNGEDVEEDVELRETLPNQDGSFQKRSVLTVSPEELKNNKYSCVIQHSSLEKELVLADMRRGGPDGGSFGVIGAVIGVAVVALIGCIAGVVVWKKKKSNNPGFQAVPGKPSSSSDEDSSSNNSSLTKVICK